MKHNIHQPRLGWENLWLQAPKTYRLNAAPDPLAVNLTSMLSEEGHVLDIGCGMGRNAMYLLNMGYSVSAVEISPTALHELKQATQNKHVSLNILQGDFIHLPFCPGSFDAAISVNVIYHATKTQIRSVIAQVVGLVRPGGWFIFNLLSKHHWQYSKYIEAVRRNKAFECESGTFMAYPEHAENDMHLPHSFIDRDGLDMFLAPYNVTHISEVRSSSPMGETGRWNITIRC